MFDQVLMFDKVLMYDVVIQIHFLSNLVSSRYQIEVMIFMHDCANEKLPVSFKNVYKMNCNIRGIYETRQAHLLHIPRTKSRFVDRLPLSIP